MLEDVARVTVFQNEKQIGVGIFRVRLDYPIGVIDFQLSEEQLPPYRLELDHVLNPDDLPDLATLADALGAVGVANDLLKSNPSGGSSPTATFRRHHLRHPTH